MHVKQSQ